MRKVLLATTALVAFGGITAAKLIFQSAVTTSGNTHKTMPVALSVMTVTSTSKPRRLPTTA